MSLTNLFKHSSDMQIDDRPAFVQEINSTLYYDYILGRIKTSEYIIEYQKKEVNMTNEYIEGFAQRKAELEAEKQQLENANLDVIVNERFAEVREAIAQEVIAEHKAKIEDKDVEIRAIERLIAREVAKLEAEQALLDSQTEGVEA